MMTAATFLSVAAWVARAGRRCSASARSSRPIRTRTRRPYCSTSRQSPRRPTSSAGSATTGATCMRTPVRRRCASTAPTSTRSATPTSPATWRTSSARWATCDAPPTRVPRPHLPSTLRSARWRCPLLSATTHGRGPSEKSARRRLSSNGRSKWGTRASWRSTSCARPGSSTKHRGTASVSKCPGRTSVFSSWACVLSVKGGAKVA
mmetsp:Transcript_43721/g.105034  ORF Transcript_43721/g.105034 Transcript_43721/m.105034 type:complete len:206 (+) Transcript_43721:172-789(+)